MTESNTPVVPPAFPLSISPPILHPEQTDKECASDSERCPSTNILSQKALADFRASLTIFKGFFGTRPCEELVAIGWDEVCGKVSPPNPQRIIDKKHGYYFIPSPLIEATFVGMTLEYAMKTGAPTTGKMRSKNHVTEAALLVLDVDGLPVVVLMACMEKMKSYDLTFHAFTTYSHGDPSKPGVRVRLLVPVDRPLNTELYAAAWQGFDWLFFEGKVGLADPSGANLYQQQGIRCVHPDRIKMAETWTNRAGVASAEYLIELGRKANPPRVSSSEPSGDSAQRGITPPSRMPLSHGSVDSAHLEKIKKLLDFINPDCDYHEWFRVGMAIFNETRGSDEGLEIFDRWSSKGSKYKGRRDIENTWKSFRLDEPNPVTIATLIKMAQDAGGDVAAIIGDNFDEIFETEVVVPGVTAYKEAAKAKNPLDKYSLLGRSGEIAKQVMAEVFVLDQIALIGQATVIYGAPNTGKTLTTLKFLRESVQQGRIDPAKVYYVNVDDSARGVLEKVCIAEESSFHMLAEGYRDFNASEFLPTIMSLIESDNTQGVIIILDTLKKFTNLMDKRGSTQFGKIIRRFVMKGGTIIGLAHTNKNPGRDGKKVHAGTTDIIEDFDCAYILDAIPGEANRKVVEFTNFKKRGSVATSVSYSYSVEPQIPYSALMMSVEKVDPMQLIPLKQAAEVLSDSVVITAIEGAIKNSINTKMKLADEVAERAKVSKRDALSIIEKYSGNDPAIHRWSFDVRDRGSKVYVLLERPLEVVSAPATMQPPDSDIIDF